MSLRSDPITSFTLPFHPDYGLDNSTRVEVLRLVVDWKVSPMEAARLYKLHPSTVYKWLAAAGHPAPRFSHNTKKDL
jgi:hypothetical protein